MLFNGEVLITECGSEALMTFKERTCEWKKESVGDVNVNTLQINLGI